MVIKISTFKFDTSVFDDMFTAMFKTEIDGKEHGFDLCSDYKDIIYSENSCSGTECELFPKKKCNDERSKLVGNFHTHPDKIEFPSFGDLTNAYYEKIVCIGNDNLNCFIRKTPYDLKIHKEIYINHEKYEPEDESLEKYIDKTKHADEIIKTIKKYFDIYGVELNKYTKKIEISNRHIEKR